VKLPGYELTDHAAGVIAERDIDITWVVRVLAKPTELNPIARIQR